MTNIKVTGASGRPEAGPFVITIEAEGPFVPGREGARSEAQRISDDAARLYEALRQQLPQATFAQLREHFRLGEM